jgi:hypothetical protein
LPHLTVLKFIGTDELKTVKIESCLSGEMSNFIGTMSG